MADEFMKIKRNQALMKKDIEYLKQKVKDQDMDSAIDFLEDRISFLEKYSIKDENCIKQDHEEDIFKEFC